MFPILILVIMTVEWQQSSTNGCGFVSGALKQFGDKLFTFMDPKSKAHNLLYCTLQVMFR